MTVPKENDWDSSPKMPRKTLPVKTIPKAYNPLWVQYHAAALGGLLAVGRGDAGVGAWSAACRVTQSNSEWQMLWEAAERIADKAIDTIYVKEKEAKNDQS